MGRFSVDAQRVVASGYSGGATYLGWYAPRHATRFGAVAYVAGGAAYTSSCSPCKMPVLFVLGATDPMIAPYTRPLRDWYDACGGHEIVWETLPGVTHESILQVLEAGRARRILGWLLSRPATCADAVAAVDASSLLPDAGAEAPPPAVPRREEGEADLPPRVPPRATGCACNTIPSAAAPRIATLLVFVFVALRRRRRRPIL
jgi:MYXO-CTERM domain-containing protein